MSLFLFGKGILLGLAIAAPLGPIGTLCISRTLERGFWAGIAGGLGTALADCTFALMAAAGFAAFTMFFDAITVPLQLFGGAFMLWLGVKSFQPRPAAVAASIGARDLFSTTVATFLLTMANPATILSFAAILAGLGIAGAVDGSSAAFVVVGVFAGSLLWWFFLCGTVSLLHHRLPESFTHWVARASGLVLLVFGVLALGMGVKALLVA